MNPDVIKVDGKEWVLLGHHTVDSGQAMIVDPCYIDYWKHEPVKAPRIVHKSSGLVFYCYHHGTAPEQGALLFSKFSDSIKDTLMELFDLDLMARLHGKDYAERLREFRDSLDEKTTYTDMLRTGDMISEGQPEAEAPFSYNGVTKALNDGDKAAEIPVRGKSTAVAFCPGVGDGVYPVYGRYAEFPGVGKRLAEVRMFYLTSKDLERYIKTLKKSATK